MLFECAECRLIRDEFSAAVVAVSREFQGKTVTADWCLGMRMQTEDDVAIAERVFEEMRCQSSHRLGQIIHRKRMHELRTGHRIELLK